MSRVAFCTQQDPSANEAASHMHKYITPNQACFISLLILAISFALPKVGILVASLYIFLLVWTCDGNYILATILATFRPSDILVTGYGTLDYNLTQAEMAYINIGPLPLTTSLALTLSTSMRVILEYASRPASIRRVFSDTWFYLWILAVSVSLVMSLMGMTARNNGWALPLRYALTAGNLFYGVTAALPLRDGGRRMLKQIAYVTTAMLFAKLFISFHSRFFWVALPLLPPIAAYLLRSRSASAKLFAAIMYTLGLAYSLNIGYNDGGSLTLQGLYALSTFLTGPFMLRNFLNVGPAIRPVLKVAFPLTIITTLVVANIGPETTKLDRSTFTNEVKFKLWGDRASVWDSSIQNIMSENPILVPGGSKWIYTHPIRGEELVAFGSHNTVLEQLRVNRFLAGSIILAVMFKAVYLSTHALRKSSVPEVRVLAIAFISTGTFGVFTGHYPLADTAGFLFLALGGVGLGLDYSTRLAHHPRSAQTHATPPHKTLCMPNPNYGLTTLP